MTDAAWATLSNQAVAAAGLVYFLALLAHLVEWSMLAGQKRETAEPAVAVSAGSGMPASAGRVGTEPAAEDRERWVALFGRLGLLLTVLAAAVHLGALVGRGMAADPNRVPWSNMYEFTISGTFMLALFYLALYRRFALSWMAPVVIGVVLSLLMVAVIWLHDPVTPLADSLDSPWLVIHVVSAIIATGAFTLGGLTSLFYLVRLRRTRLGRADDGVWARIPALDRLDTISYRIHAFAFPVWTFAVLITGPIWAHQAWSRYWNWDPKEVWAFITWVVYAAYLHARTTAGWKGRNAAVLALIGTATLWFNFIGVNYFVSGSQHSYAAPTPSTDHSVESWVLETRVGGSGGPSPGI